MSAERGRKRKFDSMSISVPKSKPGASHLNVTDPALVKMPTIMTLTGQAGKGKTTAAVNFLEKMKRNELCDRIFLISPTANSNQKLWSEMNLPIDDEDTWHPDAANVIEEIQNKIKEERDEYEKYKEEMEQYRQMIRAFQGTGNITQKVALNAFNFVTMKQGQAELRRPTHKWNGKIPVLWMFFDDCQGNRIFKNNSGLSRMAIEHRHQGQFSDGGAVGVSMLLNLQNFKDRSDGCPKPVRSNSKQFGLFYTRDNKERDAVAEEAGGVTDPQTLLQKWDEATAPMTPRFLLVDKEPVDGKTVFRQNFDTPLDPPPEVTGAAG